MPVTCHRFGPLTPFQLRFLAVALALLLAAISLRAADESRWSNDLAWPTVTTETRPWTRWWWLGSAVDTTNLTRQLTQFKEAGIGGVEICPIYGAKGYESRFLDFLSPPWMQMLAHTTAEAGRLGLGVDLTTGTGWPFGGPHVTTDDASARVNLQRYELAPGETLKTALPKGRLQCLLAISDQSEPIDLTGKVSNGHLDWTPPPGPWRLYAVALDGPVMKVKRAAPGGVGNVLDPFSVAALNRYLAGFDSALAGYRGAPPRAYFHDSYEYYNAQGTPEFFREFEGRRGYDLKLRLPALFGEGPPETVARVKGDYRETLADLHLAYIRQWTEWAHRHGALTRNQAHGGAANLLDTYAAADIPEMEIYSSFSEQGMPMMKLAASAAHLSGKKLVSAESFTWLTEHFQASLSEVKQAADFLFLSGINHIFFHGIPYSPAEAAWPGWQFYAAVNFGPQGGLWRDLPEFNAYVTRCQSILQSGAPSNDVLLYLSFHGKWQTSSGNLLMPFETAGHWMESEPFYATATNLWNRGYGFDEVSDRLLADAKCANGELRLGGVAYRTLLIPPSRLMPEATLRKIVELARAGATILMQEHLPGDVPGLGNLEKRRAEFRELLGGIHLADDTDAGVQKAILGEGRIFVGSNLEALLRAARIARESAVDLGLRLVRRTHAQGHQYFLANRSERSVDGWVTLGVEAKSAVLLDPRMENRRGVAALRRSAHGLAQVYLQLPAGESCVLRTFTSNAVEGPAWPYFQARGEAQAVAGVWKTRFIEGGPELPASFETRELASWTTRDDPEAKRFAGTASYTIEFDRPAGEADDWMLDLGRVCESARVKLNGHIVGALWCAPFQITVGQWLKPGLNRLEVEVTNLAANRIRDLDQRKVNWKYFYDANLASLRQRSGLDASVWQLRDSGLIGPVSLKPLKKLALQSP
jgi:hypothetical protein